MGKAKGTKQPKRNRSADDLTKTSNKGSIALSEGELDQISGGPTAVELKYGLKI